MCSGVGKSGSPAPKPITGRPAAFSALAFASTARVADSAIAPIRADTLEVLAMANIFASHGQRARPAICCAVRREPRRQRTLQHLVVLRQAARACLPNHAK